MQDTYKFDLAEVKFPAKIEARLEEERMNGIRGAVLRGIKREDAEFAFPAKPWEPTQEAKDAIEMGCNSYVNIKFFSKERNQVIVPATERKHKSRIVFKLSAAEDGKVTFTKDELEFILKAFDSELPGADVFGFVGDYLQSEKVAQEQAVGATA